MRVPGLALSVTVQEKKYWRPALLAQMVARLPLGPNTASRREGQTSYKVEKLDMESPAFQGFIFNRLLVRKQTVWW